MVNLFFGTLAEPLALSGAKKSGNHCSNESICFEIPRSLLAGFSFAAQIRMNKFFLIGFCWFAYGISGGIAAEPAPPAITNFTSSGTQKIIKWIPYPAIQDYSILSSTNVIGPFTTNADGVVSGFKWTGTSSVPANFYTLQVTPLGSNELLTANVLNRLAYGPTPDDLERILTGPNAIGPDAYIAEQLAPETIAETVNNSHTNINLIQAKFASPTNVMPGNTTYATIDDFRAWHVLRAVGAKRQLLEVLLQFFENHFVTQYSKSLDYFDQFYDDSATEQRIAAQFEYLENDKWRNALLNPSSTFYDLLRISAESPAMIIYLDTVTSKGNASNIANENYGRELLELFTFGVDNGYIQNDIVAMSRSWTGWTVQIVSPTNALNPFAARTTNLISPSYTNVTVVSNLAGVWAFNFNSATHDVSPGTRPKTLFTNASIPARFGAPYTTKLYGTNTISGKYTFGFPPRTGTNSIQDGYDIINFLAGMPFTQEYISVKLCRLFVHDDFPNPSNDTSNPAYGLYDYASGNLSAEAQLVRDCMSAWENSSGNIRAVLNTIFNSELFRSHGGSMQKIKTPLEYTVSAIRALRTSTNGTFLPNTYSADTDGYNLIKVITTNGVTLDSVLNRMGAMSLFDRTAPDGYPEDAPYWISAGTLAERIRFVQSLSISAGQAGHTGALATSTNDAGNNTYCSPGLLIQAKLPATSLTNATAVVDYLLGVIYPGEGAGNLNEYRTAAINFLNSGSADPSPNSNRFGSAAVPFSLSATSSYDTRVRGLVGYLLSLQRFHEQ